MSSAFPPVDKTRLFYTQGGAVGEGALYISRKADRDFLQAVERGDYVFLLNPRQCGKSSLIANARRTSWPHNTFYACINFQGRLNSKDYLGSQPDPREFQSLLFLDDTFFYRYVAMDVMTAIFNTTAMAGDPEDSVLQHWDAYSSKSGSEIFELWLTETMKRFPDWSLFVIFEEFDAIKPFFRIDHVIATLKRLHHARMESEALRRVSFCVIAGCRPIDLAGDTMHGLFDIGTFIELQDFSRSELCVLEPHFSQFTTTASMIVDRIYWLAAGHPSLTQQFCADVASRDDVQTPEEVDDIVNVQGLKASFKTNKCLCGVLRGLELFAVDKTGGFSKRLYIGLLDDYRRILRGKRKAKITDEHQQALLMSGLIKPCERGFAPRNRVYETCFDIGTIDNEIRRYSNDSKLRNRKMMFAGATCVPLVGAAVLLTIFRPINDIASNRMATNSSMNGKTDAKNRHALKETGVFDSDGQLMFPSPESPVEAGLTTKDAKKNRSTQKLPKSKS